MGTDEEKELLGALKELSGQLGSVSNLPSLVADLSNNVNTVRQEVKELGLRMDHSFDAGTKRMGLIEDRVKKIESRQEDAERRERARLEAELNESRADTKNSKNEQWKLVVAIVLAILGFLFAVAQTVSKGG